MSSREQDKAPNQSPEKAIDGLLRRSLARSARSQDCPAPDILAAYYERSLDAGETARYELHFSTCAHCRAQLAAIVRAGEPEPAQKQASGWGWFANRWWFVPAMAAAALGLIISVRVVRKIYAPVPAEMVAMNAPAQAPASAPASDSAASRDSQLLDRAREKAPPPAPPAAVLEKKSKDQRFVVPRSDLTAQSQTPQPVAKAQAAQGAPAAADALTADAELDASRPVASAAATRVAPAPARASGARAAGGFNAQNQVQQQELRQNQQLSQQQNEAAVQSQSPAPAQSQVQATEAVPVVSGGVAGGVAQAPQSDSKELAETSRANVAAGKLVLKGDASTVQNAKQSYILKVYPSPDTDAWWRLPGGGIVEFSPDAGETWQRQLVDKNAQFLVGAAPGKRVFWIAGRDGVIYLATNGTNWKKVTSPAHADIVVISASDSRTASVTTADRRVFTTEDGGKTWNSAP